MNVNQLTQDFQDGAKGHIIHWQSTYVDIEYFLQAEPEDIKNCRIHFKGKKSFFLARKPFFTVAVSDTHPLLLEFNEPHKNLFFASSASDAETLLAELQKIWQQTFGDWKQYTFSLSKVTEKGPGLFYAGPASFVDAAFPLLELYGMRPTSLSGKPPSHQFSVLLLDRCYVVAEQFHTRD